MNALRAVSEQEPDGLDLIQNWEGALRLHIHADRGHLTDLEFDQMRERALAFIGAMLPIYERERMP